MLAQIRCSRKGDLLFSGELPYSRSHGGDDSVVSPLPRGDFTLHIYSASSSSSSSSIEQRMGWNYTGVSCVLNVPTLWRRSEVYRHRHDYTVVWSKKKKMNDGCARSSQGSVVLDLTTTQTWEDEVARSPDFLELDDILMGTYETTLFKVVVAFKKKVPRRYVDYDPESGELFVYGLDDVYVLPADET